MIGDSPRKIAIKEFIEALGISIAQIESADNDGVKKILLKMKGV